MSRGRRRTESALLLRAWLEDDDPERMRVRCVVLTSPGGESRVCTTADDVIDAVRRWLDSVEPERRPD